jgi:predicted type IV restriction endonuclease
MVPPKRVADRIGKSVVKFQQVLQIARDRDVNEADTVSIVKDILAEVFGYDKYLEVTSELAIRGTFVDLAIRVASKIEYLIEAKAIGTDLRELHLRQAIEYGASNGVPWVILTNGMVWRIYKIRFEQPISHDLVCDFSFSEIDGKSQDDQEKLFIICKEGINKDAREQFHEKIQCLNRFVLGALILSDDVVTLLRRELRKVTESVLVAPEDIVHVLENEVLKRDVIEGDEAQKARSRLKKFYGKSARKPHDEGKDTETPPSQPDLL